MRIIIANSNTWFRISDEIKSRNEILCIDKKDELTITTIKDFSPELIFFPHWSWIVPKQIYENFVCIVFHTAPLPFGRGGSPIQNLILNGYKESPVCALKMTSEIDAGPIYTHKKISLKGSLKEIFKELNIATNEIIDDLISYLPHPKEQKGLVVKFNRLKRKDNLLPSDISIEKIYDRIRMLDYETYPKAFINYGKLKFEFVDAILVDGEIVCKTRIIQNDEF